ncbi:hypothetical protein [Novilysobacter spongiicola]|uniref:Uncharacterized protein n=1 Tax=Lysobacter spongiicola DSM 21749 TaxID=1122188 RepID=A0A1T4S6W4_9GAMM|nr:hypothetical protein [Lysobacter spongiicola]SKA23638.1 hypothetical protein SAMN02745674_02586 [Lysobacter spongiicola DSM 21749]
MKVDSNRLLFAWAGALTIGLGVVLLTGATGVRSQKFDVIDVQRINVREPDGTLRMVVSNREQFPGLIMKGEEFKHDRGAAGIVFFNDEGTENGGLAFAGRRKPDGSVQHFVHLSMDRFEEDQVTVLNHIENGKNYQAGLTVNDRSEESSIESIRKFQEIESLGEVEREALIAELGEGFAERVFLGRRGEGEALVMLRDGEGRPRLRLAVQRDGTSSIEFLDDQGEVSGKITPESLRQ